MGHPDLMAFASFPEDLQTQVVHPHAMPALALLMAETGLAPETYPALFASCLAASVEAQWRDTYKDTDIGQDFMDRFGCYTIIGHGGAFQSAQLWSWVVYMPAGLHYPWHQHPGEEIYLVLAGEAEFMRWGEPGKTLRQGDTSDHASNQPHAMTTHEHPVLCLVLWRNGFDVGPVLSVVPEAT
jgi:quercetin dioxygenase-like cupin family protein